MSEGRIVPTALITGASRGIGRGIACSFAEAGWSVIIGYAGNQEAAEETARLCREASKTNYHDREAVGSDEGGGTETKGPGTDSGQGGSLLSKASQYREQTDPSLSEEDEDEDTVQRFPVRQADVRRNNDRERLVEFAWNEFGGIDCLINNAGIAPRERSDLLEMGENSYDEVLDTNLKGPFFLTQAVASRWLNSAPRSSAPDTGNAEPDSVDTGFKLGPGTSDDRTVFKSVIFISSISAETVSINRGEYCLSKSALAMTASLFAVRLADAGIPVYEIRPGIIETDMTSGVKEKYDRLIAEGLVPQKRWGKPEDIGRAALALARGDFGFSTGDVFYVDGGLHIGRL